MVRKRISRIEIVIVLVVLGALLYFMIPYFEANQIRRDEHQILHDLEAILYGTDITIETTGLYPRPEMSGGYAASTVIPVLEFSVLSMELGHYTQIRAAINPQGNTFGRPYHIEWFTNLPVAYETLQTDGTISASRKSQHIHSAPDAPVLVLKIAPARKQITKEHYDFAIAYPWPHAVGVDDWVQMHWRADFEDSVAVPLEDSDPLLGPEWYFNPSNGIRSHGFVYADSRGNTSLDH